MKKYDEEILRMQRQTLPLQEQSYRLRMYETLFLRESSTASQGERQCAESKKRSVFFASLLDDGITNIDAFAPALPPSSILPRTPAEPHSSVDIVDVPRVHGQTVVDTV
jgi:hypothetical protein